MDDCDCGARYRRPKILVVEVHRSDDLSIEARFDRRLTDAERVALREHIKLLFDGQIPFQSPRSPLSRHAVRA